jgi:hypothetical protein
LSDSPSVPHVTAAQLLLEERRDALILDSRPAEDSASFYIRGSIQISLMGNFASWAAIIINPAQKVLLIAKDARDAQEFRNRLARVGLGRVLGYPLADEKEWRKQGLELATIPVKRCEQIRRTLGSDSRRLASVRHAGLQ